MKRSLLTVLTAVGLLMWTLPAAAEVKTVLDAVSAASGSSAVIDTGGAKVLNVQVCGTGFSGTVLVKQGAAPTKVVTTKTFTLVLNSDCTNYYSLVPSTSTQITYTRSAGSVTVYLEVLK
jgi:hypothetical protein